MGFMQKFQEGWNNQMARAELRAKIDRQPSIKLEFVGGLPNHSSKEIKIFKGFDPRTAFVDRDKEPYAVINVQWQEQFTRSAGKAAVGAIVGGAISLGVGTIVGAAIGGRKRDNSIAVVSLSRDGTEYHVYVRCSQKEFQKLTSFIL